MITIVHGSDKKMEKSQCGQRFPNFIGNRGFRAEDVLLLACREVPNEVS